MFGYFFTSKVSQETKDSEHTQEPIPPSFELSKEDRLGSYSFEKLLKNLCKSLGAITQTLDIKSTVATSMRVKYFSLTSKPSTEESKPITYHVFPVTKDACRDYTLTGLAFLSDVVKHYMDKYPEDKSSSLLFPLHQSDRYFEWIDKLRHHMVIVEVNLATKKYIVHDSQSSVCSLIYRTLPLAPELNFTPEWISYGKQTDAISCGYYGFLYVFNILLAGHSKDCHDITLCLTKLDKKSEDLRSSFVAGDWKILGARSIPSTVSSEDSEDYVVVNTGLPESFNKAGKGLR